MVTDNAEAGIALAQGKLPDLITMDSQLPGMNGELALKILKADERTKNIPVVFVTASVMEMRRNDLLPIIVRSSPNRSMPASLCRT